MKAKNRPKENMREYESLRNEIISLEEQQRNVWIYMYVIFSTLFVLGLEWSPYLFLVNYIILIPFQCVINSCLRSVQRISTYIRVFFEDCNSGFNWESLQISEEYLNYFEKKNNGITDLIRKSGATHLGVITTVFFCWQILSKKSNYNIFELDAVDIILILISILLLFILIKINIDYNKNYYYEMEKMIRKYKERIEKS